MKHKEYCKIWEINNSASNGSGFPEPEDVACTCGVGSEVKCPNCEREVKIEDFDEYIGMCNECINSMQEAENEQKSRRVQVTRDMATDAGDKSLEGQWIDW